MDIKPGQSRGIKQAVKRLAARLLYDSGWVRLYSLLAMKDKALVLMYHRVLDETQAAGAVHPGMYVARNVFEQHLRYLSRRYRVVSLGQFERWLSGALKISGVPCLITFDDGWQDNYHHAFPLLKAYSLPAAVFLATGRIGKKEMLTWDQARDMESAGISFGSHTVTHAVLRGKNRDEIRRELVDSKNQLRKELDRPCDWFCYPKGEYDAAAESLVREFYGAALTTERGVVSPGDDPFRIKRIGIHDDVSMTVPLFACRILAIF